MDVAGGDLHVTTRRRVQASCIALLLVLPACDGRIGARSARGVVRIETLTMTSPAVSGVTVVIREGAIRERISECEVAQSGTIHFVDRASERWALDFDRVQRDCAMGRCLTTYSDSVSGGRLSVWSSNQRREYLEVRAEIGDFVLRSALAPGR
jgi:hypothetical protein